MNIGQYKNRTLVSKFILFALLTICACRRPSDHPKIGVILSTTGPAAAYGIDGRHGIDLAQSVINESGGLNGKKVEFVIQDSGGDPANAVMIARRFASDQDVVAILGPTRTSEAVAVSRTLDSLRVPVISVGSTGDWLTAAGSPFGPWMFRSTRVDTTIVEPLLQYLQRHNTRTIALLYSSDDDWSRSITVVYRDTARQLGMNIVADESIPVGDPNEALQLLKVKNAHPDAIIMNLLAGDAPGAVSRARDLGITAQIAGTAGFTNRSTWSLAKPGALDGVLVGENYYPNSPRPAVRTFVTKYRKEFGSEPPPYSAYAYDGASILVDALRRCDNYKDRDAVRRALGSTANFQGVLGELSYHGSGDAEKPTVLLRIQNGDYSLVH